MEATAVSPFCAPSHPSTFISSQCAIRRRLPSTHAGGHLPRKARSRACSRASSSPPFGEQPSRSSVSRTDIGSEAIAGGARQGWLPRPRRFTCRQLSSTSTCRRHEARKAVPPRASNEADVASEASDQSYKTYKNGALHSGEPRADDELSASERLVQTASTVLPGIRDFCVNNFLLLSISSAILAGLVYPPPGIFAHKQLGLTRHCTFTIFFVSGLMLDVQELAEVVSAWPLFAFGVVSSLAITPLMAPLILQLPIHPRELPTGLALFCCMPTTITAGISLARAAGANLALALSLTVVTNTIGILTMPFFLSSAFRAAKGFQVPVLPLLSSLVVTLLLPLCIGMAARRASRVLAAWADQRRRQLSMTNNLLLSLVPWMQVSSARSAIMQLEPAQLLTIASAGIAVHMLYVLFNSAVVTAIQLLARQWSVATGSSSGPISALPLPSASPSTSASTSPSSLPSTLLGRMVAPDAVCRAVIILASQKPLPVSATVADRLGGVLGSPALILLPCIIAHFCQIFIDTLIVSSWLDGDRRREEALRHTLLEENCTQLQQ